MDVRVGMVELERQMLKCCIIANASPHHSITGQGGRNVALGAYPSHLVSLQGWFRKSRLHNDDLEKYPHIAPTNIERLAVILASNY